MRRIVKVTLAMERIAVAVGCLSLLALMSVVSVDVVMRYSFNRPFVWTHDVVTLYLMPMIFFLLVSDSFRDGAQIRVDIVYHHFSPKLRDTCDAFGNTLAAAVFALILYGGLLQAIHAMENREVVAGSIPWPVWPSYGLLAIGATMLIVRLVADAAKILRMERPSGISSKAGVHP